MRVIVLDSVAHDIDLEREVLEAAGHSLEFLEGTSPRRADRLSEAAAILTLDERVDGTLLDAAPQCQLVATYGIGYDNIDVEAARRRGVKVTNVPDYCTEEVADHTVALTLALLRRVVVGDCVVRSGGWGAESVGEMRRVRGQVLGLIGLGRIARAVAVRARAFGFEIVAYDALSMDAPPDGVRLVTFEALLATADVVSIHVPLTPESKRLIGGAEIARMKPGAVLVNTSRGRLLDLDALLCALADGRLGGAALDVFPEEPPDAGRFIGRADVVLTPHVAFASIEAMDQSRRSAARTIADILSGHDVPNRVV